MQLSSGHRCRLFRWLRHHPRHYAAANPALAFAQQCLPLVPFKLEVMHRPSDAVMLTPVKGCWSVSGVQERFLSKQKCDRRASTVCFLLQGASDNLLVLSEAMAHIKGEIETAQKQLQTRPEWNPIKGAQHPYLVSVVLQLCLLQADVIHHFQNLWANRDQHKTTDTACGHSDVQ